MRVEPRASIITSLSINRKDITILFGKEEIMPKADI